MAPSGGLDRIGRVDVLCAAVLAQPPQPLMSAVFPAGGQRGTTLAATVMGTNLQGAVGVHISGAGVTGTCGYGRQAGHDSGVHHGRSRRAAGRTRYPCADTRRLFESLSLPGRANCPKSTKSNRTRKKAKPSLWRRCPCSSTASCWSRISTTSGSRRLPGRPSSVPCKAARFCPTFPMPCRVGWMPA